jgi:hypothetical protein
MEVTDKQLELANAYLVAQRRVNAYRAAQQWAERDGDVLLSSALDMPIDKAVVLESQAHFTLLEACEYRNLELEAALFQAQKKGGSKC